MNMKKTSLTPGPSPKERGAYSSSVSGFANNSKYSPLLGRGVGLRLLFLLLLFTACHQESTMTPLTESERDATDSIVATAKGLEATRNMLNSFRQSGNVLGQIVSLRQMGKLYRDDSQFLKAIECHQEGLKLATQACDTLEMVLALNNIGTNYRRLGSLEEAATNHQMAVLLSGNMSDQTSERALKNRTSSLNGMGNVLMGLENYDHAENILRQSLELERVLDSKVGLAMNMANIGSIKKRLGQRDSAWHYFQEALEMNKQGNSQLGIGLCHIRFGELFVDEGQLDKAISEFQTAYTILEKVGDDWHWMEAVLNTAHIHIVQGKYDEARHYLDMARQTIERIGAQEQQVRVYQLYYELYEKTGNLRLALDNYVRATTLKDSLVNTKTVTNVQNQRMASEQLRQEHLLRQAEHQLEMEQAKKKAITIVAILVVLLALAALMLMWLYFRNRAAKERIRQQMQQDREDFLTNLALNLRTPTSAIVSTGHHLEELDMSREQEVHAAAKMIVRQGNSLLTLIDQMLKDQ